MKCRSCGQTAAINMRHHKLALCREHYLEWIPEQTERFIHKYDMFTRDDRLLVDMSYLWMNRSEIGRAHV